MDKLKEWAEPRSMAVIWLWSEVLFGLEEELSIWFLFCDIILVFLLNSNLYAIFWRIFFEEI